MNHQSLRIVSWVALSATILPSILSWLGVLNLNVVSHIALVGTIVWFAVTPFWMDREPEIDDQEVQI
jgi:hypothetical protein